MLTALLRRNSSERVARVVVEQDPKRVNPERGPKRQDEQIQHAKRERGQTAIRLASLQRRAGPQVRPSDAEQRQSARRERRCGNPGRNLGPHGGDPDSDRASREDQCRTTKQQRKRAPDAVEDGE